MSIPIRRMSPDTCDCQIFFNIETNEALTHIQVEQICRDEAAKGNKNVNLQPQRPVVACPAHAALSLQAMWEAVLSENRRKNEMFHRVAKIVKPSLNEQDDYTWAFDAERRLVVSFRGATITDKAVMQAAADLRFGLGKVKVQ